MKVVQISTQLTLKELPWLAWFGSATFFAGGGYAALTAKEAWPSSVCLISGLLVFLIFGEINTCDVNTHTGQFTLKRQGLLTILHIAVSTLEEIDG